MHSENLFTNYSQIENNAPLADKLRPNNLVGIIIHDMIMRQFPQMLLIKSLVT